MASGDGDTAVPSVPHVSSDAILEDLFTSIKRVAPEKSEESDEEGSEEDNDDDHRTSSGGEEESKHKKSSSRKKRKKEKKKKKKKHKHKRRRREESCSEEEEEARTRSSSRLREEPPSRLWHPAGDDRRDLLLPGGSGGGGRGAHRCRPHEENVDAHHRVRRGHGDDGHDRYPPDWREERISSSSRSARERHGRQEFGHGQDYSRGYVREHRRDDGHGYGEGRGRHDYSQQARPPIRREEDTFWESTWDAMELQKRAELQVLCSTHLELCTSTVLSL
jgi:hypothetical protein